MNRRRGPPIFYGDAIVFQFEFFERDSPWRFSTIRGRWKWRRVGLRGLLCRREKMTEVGGAFLINPGLDACPARLHHSDLNLTLKEVGLDTRGVECGKDNQRGLRVLFRQRHTFKANCSIGYGGVKRIGACFRMISGVDMYAPIGDFKTGAVLNVLPQ